MPAALNSSPAVVSALCFPGSSRCPTQQLQPICLQVEAHARTYCDLFHNKYKTKSLAEGVGGAVFLTDAIIYYLGSRSERFAAICLYCSFLNRAYSVVQAGMNKDSLSF